MEYIKIGNGSIPMFIVDIKDNNVVSIDVYSDILKCHFQKIQHLDFQRYCRLSEKQLNDIGFSLIENKDNWTKLNELHKVLNNYYINHLNYYYNDDGRLDDKYYHYSFYYILLKE